MPFPISGQLIPSPYLSHCFRDIRLQSAWPVQIVTAHARYHVTCTPLCKIWLHILISHPHIAYSLWHLVFYWAPMKNKGYLLMRPPMLKAKSSESFLSPDQILTVLGVWGSGVSKTFVFYSKRHICAWTHVVWAILRQNRPRGVTSRSVREK